jgi:hypothetical protein
MEPFTGGHLVEVAHQFLGHGYRSINGHDLSLSENAGIIWGTRLFLICFSHNPGWSDMFKFQSSLQKTHAEVKTAPIDIRGGIVIFSGIVFSITGIGSPMKLP